MGGRHTQQLAPVPVSTLLQEALASANVSLPSDPGLGDHFESTTADFLEIMEGRGLLTRARFETFANDAISLLERNRDELVHDERWERFVGDGRVFIYRTQDQVEFLEALDQVKNVLDAIKGETLIPGVRINIRGTEGFFDIRGLSGVNPKAWIGFVLSVQSTPK